jgi:hypothetical protein
VLVVSIDFLQQELERSVFTALSEHGWSNSWSPLPVGTNEKAALVTATREGVSHRFIYIRGTGIADEYFKTLDAHSGEFILAGSIYNVDDFGRGVATEIIPVERFTERVFAWNAGLPRVVATSAIVAAPSTPSTTSLRVRGEQPIQQIWGRLGQLASVQLSRATLAARWGCDASGVDAESAEALSYLIRNARDYYRASATQSTTQRALSLYYGSVAFVQAEMLSHPKGPRSVEAIERSTKVGAHGLMVEDLDEANIQPGTLAIAPMKGGLFGRWAELLGCDRSTFHEARPKKGPLQQPYATLDELLARIPEIGDLFAEVTSKPPGFAHVVGLTGRNFHIENVGSYLEFFDDSGRITPELLAEMCSELSEVRHQAQAVPPRIRAYVSHPGKEYAWSVLKVHVSGHKPMLIAPLWGQVREHRAICVVTLYALSIMVRYRPWLWRQILEGHLDQYRNLIEAFLDVAERVLPESFLGSIRDQRVRVTQPGSFFD